MAITPLPRCLFGYKPVTRVIPAFSTHDSTYKPNPRTATHAPPSPSNTNSFAATVQDFLVQQNTNHSKSVANTPHCRCPPFCYRRFRGSGLGWAKIFQVISGVTHVHTELARPAVPPQPRGALVCVMQESRMGLRFHFRLRWGGVGRSDDCRGNAVGQGSSVRQARAQ